MSQSRLLHQLINSPARSVYTGLNENHTRLNTCTPHIRTAILFMRQTSVNFISLFSPSVLTAIFPGKPELVGFIGAKADGSGGDNRSYKTRKALSNCHHHQTNTHHFTGRMSFLSPNQQCQSTERKNITFAPGFFKINRLWRYISSVLTYLLTYISRTCSPQAHLGSSNFVSDH